MGWHVRTETFKNENVILKYSAVCMVFRAALKWICTLTSVLQNIFKYLQFRFMCIAHFCFQNLRKDKDWHIESAEFDNARGICGI